MTGKTNKQFTGKHMAGVLIGGFGIVVAVNFYMASLATGGFHGVVVENSYVASQNFNDWLKEAESARALGWRAQAHRDENGRVNVVTQSVPENAVITAELRRPIGSHEFASLSFSSIGDGRHRSTESVLTGRWTVRLFIEADGQKWAQEFELE